MPICSAVLRIWKRKEAGGRTGGRPDPGRKDGSAGKVLRAGCPLQRERADASSTTNAPNSRKERTAVRPVKRVQNRMVSSLAQPGERHCFRICRREKYRFPHPGRQNAIFRQEHHRRLCAWTQTVSDGQAPRIRLLEPMAVDDRSPKGTVLVGGTRPRGTDGPRSRQWNTGHAVPGGTGSV